MMKSRAVPILASAAIALSLAACQGMGGGEAGQRQQTGSAQAAGTEAQQALAPDLVRNIQRTLSQRGYDPGPADGVYGESTQQALRNFQRDQKLNSTGQLDSQTLAALGVVAQGSRAATGPARQDYQSTTKRGAMMEEQRRQPPARQQAQAPSDLSYEQVRNLQQELASRGYDTGPVDGMWGRSTQQALRQFQQDQNLPASGRPDQRTLSALGVEGAGVQTGEMPAERTRPARPDQRGEARPEQPEGFGEREQTGQLPETEAPGSEPQSERTGATEGTGAEAGPGDIPEDSAPQVTPSPDAPRETR